MKLYRCFVLITGVFAVPGCVAFDATTDEPQQVTAQVITSLDVPDPATVCTNDPRVVTGVVAFDTCVGANLFFRGTFGGNGRTCATCHRVDNNLTIDPKFIATLPNGSSGFDPLFVAEHNTALQDLEKPPQMHQFGVILENVDGFDPDPRTHFVLRSVPHTLSLATSVTRPSGGVNPPADRTGWSGDGAPGTGALRDFMTGAIRQHYTRSLARVEGTDFRLASDTQLDQIDLFMRRIGRSNELALSTVVMSDAGADAGRTTFQNVGCTFCHNNAGANEIGGGNGNFNTGVESARNPALATFPQDGGFGIISSTPAGPFGDGTFNVPPLIEAADTGPFFHTATSIVQAVSHNVATATTIEEAIAFYTSTAFRNSPSAPFVTPFNATQLDNMGRFLRGINAAFSAAIAIARCSAELKIIASFHNTQIAIQNEMIRLANVEVGDAIRVLSEVSGLNASSLASFRNASTLLTKAQTDTAEADRLADVTSARTLVSDGSSAIGTHLNYNIGEGSVMF